MPVLAMRAIRAKPHVMHAVLLNVLGVVLVDAIWQAAVAIRVEVVAHRHAVQVVLVEEFAGVAHHTHAQQPVRAHGLPGAAAAEALVMAVLDGGGAEVVEGRQGGGRAQGNGTGSGGGGVEVLLEIEDEIPDVAVHFVDHGSGGAAAALVMARPDRGGAVVVGGRQGGGRGRGRGSGTVAGGVGVGVGVGVEVFLEIKDEIAVVDVHFLD